MVDVARVNNIKDAKDVIEQVTDVVATSGINAIKRKEPLNTKFGGSLLLTATLQ